MKQLVILSGKGGTGKTSVAAAIAHLASHGPLPLRAILVDADVDAANLDLVLQPTKLEDHEFIGGCVAVIDEDLCQACGRCALVCRFEAILEPVSVRSPWYRVDAVACEGCASCMYQCPSQAIKMVEQIAGRWFHSDSRYGSLFHAELLPAQENSGKLVTLVRQQARLQALDTDSRLVIIDGPPGIGCPVISAASGADLALIVTEPGAAAIHDLERVLQTTRHFRLPSLVCINKSDLYPQGTRRILDFCAGNQIEVIGMIPFDESIALAMMNGEPVTACCPDSPASQALVALWQHLFDHLEDGR